MSNVNAEEVNKEILRAIVAFYRVSFKKPKLIVLGGNVFYLLLSQKGFIPYLNLNCDTNEWSFKECRVLESNKQDEISLY